MQKQIRFNKFWHSDTWVEKHVQHGAQFNYSTGGVLREFTGTHPGVMKSRVASESWPFLYSPKNVSQSGKERVLNWIEKRTGYRLAEYKNYVLI